ncbi:hypothetical protein JCM33374_g1191 [Metschnikowia sp. JCM 33374]|nr:hypothetical protein JCM33374_g1191 [Metschnikowia sp. JCM 33374]
MSTNRLRLQVDQENQHKVGPVKNELRNAFQRENAQASMPSKRPLSAKGNTNDKRQRMPLGGKDQNKIFSGLQRSKSSLPSTFHTPPLRQQQHPLITKPTLAKSNSSLGFFTQPSKPSPPLQAIAKLPPTNPLKNNLLPPAESHRTAELVPRFSSDSLTKAPSRNLPALERPLSETLSDATSRLHVSNNMLEEPFARNVDPMKKGARGPEFESIIEALAEDEESIEIVPERNEPLLEDLPLGISPLSKSEAPFLYEEMPKQKLTAGFDANTQFYPDESDQDISETEAEKNKTFHAGVDCRYT